MGKIIVITGPMFSGKSTEALRLLERYVLLDKEVLYVIPEVDTRTKENVSISNTRGTFLIPVKKAHKELTSEEFAQISLVEVLVLDEVQFFDLGIVETCQKLKDAGITIIASGLDMDYRRKPFDTTAQLMAIADEVRKLTAVCSCGNEAIYTYRKSQEEDVVLIGDRHYSPKCHSCYIKPQKCPRCGNKELGRDKYCKICGFPITAQGG